MAIFREPWLLRATAALVAAAFLAPFLDSAARSFVAVAIFLLIALSALCGWKAYQDRRDRYDLSRLWELEDSLDHPEDDPEADLAYCHRCGTAFPQAYATCPNCGHRMGS